MEGWIEMTILEAIQKRRSVRTFDGSVMKKEDAQKILDYANTVTNPYDIPVEWRLLDAKEEGLNNPVIVGTDTYIAEKMSCVPHAEEAFGYAFEKIVLFAEALGIGTTWITGTMNLVRSLPIPIQMCPTRPFGKHFVLRSLPL